MLVEVILEFLELLVRDHVSVAGIAGDRIPIREMADRVNCVTDLLVLTMEREEGHPDRFPILLIRCIAGYSDCIGSLESRKENLLLFL